MTVLTCDRADLAWALKAVLPHVLRERGFLPVLEGVRLEASPDDKSLYCIATDRYTLGVARVDAVVDEPAATIIDRSDVGEMLRRLRAKGECELVVYDDGDVCLDWRARWPGVPMPEPPGYSGYPDWRSLVARTLRYPARTPGPGYGWDAGFMARFAPAMRDAQHNGSLRKVPLVYMPVAKMPGSAPVTVVLGEHFTGLAMCCRLDGTLNAPAALRRWRELLPKEAAS